MWCSASFCDLPGDEPHRDIPDWLYEKTKDGKDYDISYGKGYSPNYANRVFIEAHAKAIAALGKRFGQDTFFSYVELGRPGTLGRVAMSNMRTAFPACRGRRCGGSISPPI